MPVGASNVSSPSVKRAAPRTTTYSSSVPLLLAVRFDQLITRLLGLPGVDSEGLETEAATQRPQEERPVGRPQPVEVVQPENLVAALGLLLRAERRSPRPQLRQDDGVDPLDAVDALLEVLGAGPVPERGVQLAVVAQNAQALDELRS